MGGLWCRGGFRCALLLALATGLMAVWPSGVGAEFGLQPGSFASSLLDASGAAIEQPQAGAHPFAVRLDLTFNTRNQGDGPVPDGEAKSFRASLPPGLLGNSEALPRCASADFLPERVNGGSRCPTKAQVGVVKLVQAVGPDSQLEHLTLPIYNLIPPREAFARFGFAAFVPIVIDVGPRAGNDYALTASVRNLSEAVNVYSVSLILWGVPADSGHDSERFLPGAFEPGDGSGGPLPSDQPRVPFVNLPTRCGTTLTTGLQIDSWQDPGRFLSYLSSPLTLVGCNQLAFEPTTEARPTTARGDSPSGLELELHIPQNEDVDGHEDPDGVASAQLRDATVNLPAGMTVNPAAAALLDACSLAQVGISAVGIPDEAPVTCPDSSKLGVAQVSSPAVGHPLPGSIYLATPEENPFGSLLALYLIVDDPASGLLVKLAGKVESDSATGQLAVRFEGSPQLPFEDVHLRIFGGPTAPLRTPATCGRYVTATSLVPWTAPEGAEVHSTSSFGIGPATAAEVSCAAPGVALPYQPTFRAGSTDPAAGSFSPLVLRLARNDGLQGLGSVDATLPAGLLAKLDGTPHCAEGNLAAAAERSGASELAQPSCPAASRVGRVDVGAGAGPNPLYLSGQAYLAGPYRSAPLSLAIVMPVLAGPFDLGTVVVRIALSLDPATARVRAESDALPTILRGIPLDVRSIALRLDKPGFTLNPTSCEPATIDAEATSGLGQRAALSEHFQVDDCAGLAFAPKLSLSARGGLGRGGHPSLRAVLRAGSHEAGLAAVAIELLPGELLDLRHVVALCARARPLRSCPPSSRLGRVRIRSPLVAKPLAGPIYLRTPNGRLPDLVADLRGGGFRIVLHGHATTRAGRLGIRFFDLPDAPLDKAVIDLVGGSRGIVVNSQALCGQPRRATVTLTAHNAAERRLRPRLRLRDGC
jgi:hypothetical protein